MTRWVMTVMVLAFAANAWAAAPPDAKSLTRFHKIQEATSLHQQGVALYQAGKLPEATKVFAELLQQNEGLYPTARYPQGHPVLVNTINNLAFLNQAQGEVAKAEPLYRRALLMCERLYPKTRYPQGHSQLTLSIDNLALLYYYQKEYAKAEPLLRRTLEMHEGLYPKTRYPQGHAQLALRINTLALLYYDQMEYAKAEPLFRRALLMYEGLYPKTRYPQGMPLLAQSINNLAELHKAQEKYAKAEPLFHRALQMREGLYPKTRYPQGHPELAASIKGLAALHLNLKEYAKAEPLLRRALLMCEALYPKTQYSQGHPELADSINALAMVHLAKAEYAEAESLLRRALLMCEGLYPKTRYPQGHPLMANLIGNLAVLHERLGEYGKAELLSRRALLMCEGLYPKTRFPQGHPDLAQSINNRARLHQQRGEYARAETLLRRALAMREELYPKTRFPQGHPNLAESICNLALLHYALGESAKAELLLRRALLMCEGLYPKTRYPQGHPLLAHMIHNLALLHQVQWEYAKAEPLYRRSLEIYEGLYPKTRFPQGHPDLTQSINNLALLHQTLGKYAKAELLLRRALAMCEGLYPKTRFPQGHPYLAQSISNLAGLHHAQGKYAKAVLLRRRALLMCEELYPKTRYPQGHPELAGMLQNLAALYAAQGEYAKAEPLARRALLIYAASAAALAAAAPEAISLNYLAKLPRTRDGYLSVTRPPRKMDAYPTVWQIKGALSRLYERRHLAVLAASNKESRALWDAIVALRRERERLLLAPADQTKEKDRDKRLDRIDDEIRQKEVNLLPLLPALKRSEELSRATPANLCKALPAGTALVDLLRYTHFEQDPKVPGKKGEKSMPRYVAFVVTREGVQRIELGKAKPVEDLLDLWLRAMYVQEGSPTEPAYAQKVHALLWAPLLKHLPTKASVVYVSPDAALNRLPWAALRDAKTKRILIEEHAVAVVPHGVTLLDRLTGEKPRKQARPTLLVMGDVAYNRKPSASTELALRGPAGEALKWEALAGTPKELKQILALAGKRRIVRLEAEAAGAAALLANLPTAQTAHLATHGFFADARFRTVFQLDENLFRSTRFLSGDTAQRIGAGSRSPMVLSGLVCSGANVPGTPNRGVLTAEAIAGLDLRRLNLAVLSACETGLGDRAGGEGVYGLVRAFHVAGCRDVIASLWKVDDEATAALMTLFYHYIWEEKQPPIQALRKAQLALYHNPGQIKAWSQGRAPSIKTVYTGAGKPPAKIKPTGKAHSKLWAAFTLSGLGQ